MSRIVEKGRGQVKHAGDFVILEYSSKSTNIGNEYGRSNVFITDSQQTLAARPGTKQIYFVKNDVWTTGDGTVIMVSKKCNLRKTCRKIEFCRSRKIC